MVTLWLKRGAGGQVNYLLALFYLKMTLHASTLVVAMELPTELLQNDGGGGSNDANLLKPKSAYSPFPLATDVDVELPLDIDDAMNVAANDEDMADVKLQQSLPPWLQMTDNEPQQKQRISSGTPKAFIKMPPGLNQNQLQHTTHQHKHSHTHQHSNNNHANANSGKSNGERRCSIEISSKIPGVCQPMSHIGSACVSGEYMEVFNADCM